MFESVWVPVLAVLSVLAWFFMDNLPGQDSEPLLPALLKILGLHLLGLAVAALGAARAALAIAIAALIAHAPRAMLLHAALLRAAEPTAVTESAIRSLIQGVVANGVASDAGTGEQECTDHCGDRGHDDREVLGRSMRRLIVCGSGLDRCCDWQRIRHGRLCRWSGL